jgi:hypothetical protein
MFRLLPGRHCRSGGQPAQVAGGVRFHPEQGRRRLVWFGRLPGASGHQTCRACGPCLGALRESSRSASANAVQARLCTMSTVRPECAATAAATLPRKMPERPLLPWEPSTIRLASRSSATRAIPFHVVGSLTAQVWARKPAACASGTPARAGPR